MLVEHSQARKGATAASTVKVGIVGAGYVAAHHLRAVRDLPFTRVVAIADPDAEKAEALAKKFAISHVCKTLAEMSADRPDVVHILTPPALHARLAIEALEMGAHVFVEKPMADTVEECDRMAAAARRANRVLSVNHSARFDPVVLEAIELAKSGAIGDVQAVHFIRSSDYPPYAGGPLPAPYRQGSYPFRDLGVHGLYMLEQFLGRARDLRVNHYSTGRDPLLTFDEWRAYGEFERGTGYMFLSWNTRPIQNELHIHGTRGVIHVDCFLQTCQVSRVYPGPKQIGMVIAGTLNALKKSWAVPRNMLRFITGSLKPSPGIYRCVQDFHRALHTGQDVPVSAQEGRDAIARIEGACLIADAEKARLIEAQCTQKLEQARVLVTGGAGFLGSALVARLREQGESVRLLVRRTRGKVDGCSEVLGSLGDPAIVDHALKGVEVVYHVGAAMKGGAAEFEQGTIWGTRNVIESCLKHGIKRLVYVSSLSVVDHAGHVTGNPVTEESPLEPLPKNRGAYTQTKMEAERMVLEAARQRGLQVVVIRPGQIFGRGSENVTPNGVIGIAGKWIVAGSGSRKLPLVYLDDVVDGLLAAAISDAALGQVINLVDTTPVDQNEYLRLAKKNATRVPVWFLMLAAFGIELLGKALKRGVPLSRYKIASLNPLYPFDCSRAKSLLDWTPRVGTRDGLRRTFGG